MSRAPTRSTAAGRTYLAIQKRARADRRPTDELLQLNALEAFLDRMATCEAARPLVLKGGALLAAYDVRRPTRDIDLAARQVDNEAPTAETIRDADEYSGIRVTVPSALASARITFHIDINFGDPIWPAPRTVQLPRMLGGEFAVRGYPLAMIRAEKIVTALQRGTANTRWRDFADVYLLSAKHAIAAGELGESIERVAAFRRVALAPLASVLDGFSELGQTAWSGWLRRQGLADRLPTSFARVLDAVGAFADPLLGVERPRASWDPSERAWR